MDTDFFSGSENLYKYIVTVGIVLFLAMIFLRFNEGYKLQLSKDYFIFVSDSLTREMNLIHEKSEELATYSKYVTDSNDYQLFADDDSISFFNYRIITDTSTYIDMISAVENNLNKMGNALDLQKSEKRRNDLREEYILYLNILNIFILPISIFLVSFGFYRWHKFKKVEDELQILQREKLMIEIAKMKFEIGDNISITKYNPKT